MFGLGPMELMVILVVALLVLGPKRLPDMATGLGKAIRDFKRATQDIQSQLEVDETVSKPLAELRAALTDQPLPSVRPVQVSPPIGAVVATAATAATGSPAAAALAAADPALEELHPVATAEPIPSEPVAPAPALPAPTPAIAISAPAAASAAPAAASPAPASAHSTKA